MKRKSVLMEKVHDVVKEIFLITLKFPQIYQFSIGEQLRRSTLSIPLNITEGNARESEKEKKQFLNFAYSSLKEAKYLLYFSKDIDLISEEVYQDIFKKIDEIGRLIYGLIKTLRGKI
jgi:four helix bundle protein